MSWPPGGWTAPRTSSAGCVSGAATHIGDAEVPLRLIMCETRHNNLRTAMRYVRPGAEAIAEIPLGLPVPP
ncbi:hypothetical protein OG589_33000 [Sphaerisporangium sp. NBC_01403]|uniref:hypothetical protein n=1 Tax=Sphaerisporangium sp. NBC_01403 TaxID=2903599 RepID=UPI0032472EC4